MNHLLVSFCVSLLLFDLIIQLNLSTFQLRFSSLKKDLLYGSCGSSLFSSASNLDKTSSRLIFSVTDILFNFCLSSARSEERRVGKACICCGRWCSEGM